MSRQRALAGAALAVAGLAACARRPEAASDAAPAPKPPRVESLLPGSASDWEPALAVGPRGEIYVTAGRQKGSFEAGDFSQQMVLWRSVDGGETWTGPTVINDKSPTQGDQRVLAAPDGSVLVSYMGIGGTKEKPIGLLEVARSTDGGKSFSVAVATDKLVSDKPELAMSPDGRDVYLFYESRGGPKLLPSHDGGVTWGDARLVVASEGRHFWPTGLAVAPDGVIWAAVPSVSNADIQEQKPTTMSLHVFRSDDIGATWREFPFGSSPWVPKGCVHFPECPVKTTYISLAVDGKGRVYVAYTEGAEAKKPYRLYVRATTDDGKSWSEPLRLTEASRPASGDEADADYAHVAAAGDGRVCVTWIDDRAGDRNLFARCSANAGRTWGPDILVSNRNDGAPYKSAAGFQSFHGDYGGVGFAPDGDLVAAWGEGTGRTGMGRMGTGAIWFNRVEASALVPQ